MNRIYQGRVTKVEMAGKELPGWQEHLWEHHVLFQDAVNYYLVAMAAVGGAPGSTLGQLRSQLDAVWVEIRKQGERRPGMRDGLARRFGVTPEAFTISDAFKIATDGNLPDAAEAEKYIESIVRGASGTGGPQKASKRLPELCLREFDGQLVGGAAARDRKSGEAFLRGDFQGLSSQSEIRAAAARAELGWVVNLKPSGGTLPDTGTRLLESIEHFLKVFEPVSGKASRKRLSPRTRGWLQAREGADADLRRYQARVKLITGPPVPKIGRGNADRTEALLLFKYFPEPFTFELLRSLFPPAQKKDTDRNTSAVGDPDAARARGQRKFVIRAFSSFDFFRAGGAGSFGWKEFDTTAFKDALTVVNQFRQNCDERQKKIERLAARLLLMAGEDAVADAPGTAAKEELSRLLNDPGGRAKLEKLASENGDEEESELWPSFAGDARIARLRQIVNVDLADDEGAPYGLRERTMKGWPEIRRKWRATVRPGIPFSPERKAKLKAALDQLRSEKSEEIGSHRLFEALLADEASWAIWREPTDEEGAAIAQNGWEPDDALDAFRRYCETRDELESRIERSVRLTPADAKRSRRLFCFTDACPFGARKGEFRHDQEALAVTVPIAIADSEGRFSRKSVRITYSAPRVLRDRLRLSDGSYVKTWSQPMADALWGPEGAPAQPEKDLDKAAVELMPDWDREKNLRFLLNFAPAISGEELAAKTRSLRSQGSLPKKFVIARTGSCNLRWPDEHGEPSKLPWWDHLDSFSALGVDLGVRQAAAVALVEVKSGHSAAAANFREIGEAGGKCWYAKYRAGGLLRLAGENRKVWRKPAGRETGAGLGFREELYGSRGRTATATESARAEELIRALGYEPLSKGCPNFAFPKQNDLLLVAIRWAQRRMARETRWLWMLSDPARAPKAIQEIGTEPDLEPMATEPDKLRQALRDRIGAARAQIAAALIEVTERILPVRGRSWEFVRHPDAGDFPNCRLLRLTGPSTGAPRKPIAGQRGLSMARVEQLVDLRRRWQSLNQALRRSPGERPPTAAEMRNDAVPDPCPEILRKLEKIRQQRVNQTAHLILAEALGVRLRGPQGKRGDRARDDRHGEYEAMRPPVDVIVIENLSRYRAAQGRAHSENSRLMQWCHRQISAKLKELAEPFAIPVLETPAAYSSQFCSRTGCVGFRAVEVRPADRQNYRWRKLLGEPIEKGAAASEDARNASRLFADLEALNVNRTTAASQRTLLAPQAGGPIFVPAAKAAPTPMQADLNAAINLALRAVASPLCASIHQRIRTERHGEKNFAHETRRFGAKGPELVAKDGKPLGKERHTNVFFDGAEVAVFGRARLQEESRFDYSTWAGLRATLEKRAWERCAEINRERARRWKRDAAKSAGEVF